MAHKDESDSKNLLPKKTEWKPPQGPIGPGAPNPKSNVRIMPPVLGEMEVEALAKRIQEQQAEINDLKKRVAKLEKEQKKPAPKRIVRLIEE